MWITLLIPMETSLQTFMSLRHLKLSTILTVLSKESLGSQENNCRFTTSLQKSSFSKRCTTTQLSSSKTRWLLESSTWLKAQLTISSTNSPVPVCSLLSGLSPTAFPRPSSQLDAHSSPQPGSPLISKFLSHLPSANSNQLWIILLSHTLRSTELSLMLTTWNEISYSPKFEGCW